MLVGVFDSGKGGQIVAERLQKFFPQHEFLVVNDRENLPYGDKTTAEILRLTDAAIQPLLTQTKIIIIACNTVTAVAIDDLRAKYPDHKFIGFEPAIKPAVSDSKVEKIMVLATPATLRSNKYQNLKQRVASGVTVIEPDCSTWASKIENGQFSNQDLEPIVALANEEQVDEIVLGCTHYLDVEQELRNTLPPTVKIVEPVAAVARRLEAVINELKQDSSASLSAVSTAQAGSE